MNVGPRLVANQAARRVPVQAGNIYMILFILYLYSRFFVRQIRSLAGMLCPVVEPARESGYEKPILTVLSIGVTFA
jgi:uncharacterized membrane protein (DUF106 family)